METIKKNIIKLEKEIEKCRNELTKICSHKNISPDFDKYNLYEGSYLFVCNDCGMRFVTEDPNFKAYKE
jgi:transcription initiation factor IIE alpha subunit